MNWEMASRVFVVVSMAGGAWAAWKNLPKPVRLDGRKYYPQPNGGYATVWGMIVRDAALIERLKAAQAEQFPGGAS